MKKLFTLLLTLPIISFSQSFVLTPYGLRDAQDSNKSYVVIEVPNKSAKQLYDKTLNFLREYYKNPDKVVKSTIDSEMIRFEGYEDNMSKTDLKILVSYKIALNSNYTIETKFKAGKVKYDILSNDLDAIGASAANINVNYGTFHIVQHGDNWHGWDRCYIWDNHIKLKHPEIQADIENSFNKKVLALKDYLLQEKKTDNW